jgi:RNA binding exosome subunit
MPSVPLHYVDLRAFCYATEDEERVERALMTYLPEEVELDRAVSEGHHGDRIVVLSARVERADEIRHVLDKLGELDDVDTVIEELEERVDDNCAFYLTLDKQAAFSGEVRRGDGITVRTKVEAYPAKKHEAVENARDVFEAL